MSSLYGGQGPTGNMEAPTQTGQKPWKEKLPTGYRQYRTQNFTPEQMNLHSQMFQHVAPDSYLSRLAGGDQSMFGEIEAPAFRQFNEQMGNVASRFSQGGTGSRRSSGFQNYTGQMASNFAQDLQANRQNLQRQAIMDLRGLSNDLLGQKPYDNFIQEKEESPWGPIAGKVFGPLGGFIADKATGNKRYTGTQQGVDTTLDLIKAFAGSAGKMAGAG